MRKTFYKIRLHLKAISHSLLQFLAMIIFGYFHSSLIEMLILYICFFYFKNRFEKQFDASSTWGCTILTIIVYYWASLIIPNTTISVVLVICFTYLINTISYYVRDYLDIKYPKKKKKNTNRQVIIDILGEDNLEEEQIEKFCVSRGIPRLSETIYLFLNNTLEDTADILGVEPSTITRRINNFIRTSRKG